MLDSTNDLLAAFDGHQVEGIRAALAVGADPCSAVRGKLPILWLLEEYTRSERLPECLRLLCEKGAELPDPALLPVLLDDGPAVAAALRARPTLVRHRTSLVCAFTSLADVTLLHVAAEYGNLDAARALLEAGAEVDAPAAVDDSGLNGHTALFHTVNSNRNRSEPILRLLLAAGARADLRLAGVRWGQGYPWETTCFDVTPISYAQMGLLPQMHRDEREIYANVRLLLEAAGRSIPRLVNVPNRYL